MCDATMIAGIPAENPTLFRKARLAAGDPAAWISINDVSTLVIRDIECERAKLVGGANHYASPNDILAPNLLSPDRATATAQAAAALLVQKKVSKVRTDRSLPYIFAWHVLDAGIEIQYDSDLGVIDRRVKTEAEIEVLATVQGVTENAVEYACREIASAAVLADGTLQREGEPLTAERMRTLIARFLLDRQFSMPHGAIVATAPYAADCHHYGKGPLKTGVPIIIDIFPRDEVTRYWGDCTRTVVHGTPSDDVLAMHHAVVEAKAVGIAALQIGNRADAVHQATIAVQQRYGYQLSRGVITDHPTIQHGTGHGVGLELHEPILIDDGGEPILEHEVFTIEPGLYGRTTGGVRIEDMVVVTKDGPRNLNLLREGLDWAT